MKIVIAPDKFKGSLTGIEFCHAVASGIHEILPGIKILKIPMADGGDGTMAALETEVSNDKATRLYTRLGFQKDKLLLRYYLNGGDAWRLKLLFG